MPRFLICHLHSCLGTLESKRLLVRSGLGPDTHQSLFRVLILGFGIWVRLICLQVKRSHPWAGDSHGEKAGNRRRAGNVHYSDDECQGSGQDAEASRGCS